MIDTSDNALMNRRRRIIDTPVVRVVQGIQKGTYKPFGALEAFPIYMCFNTEGLIIGASRDYISRDEWQRLIAK